MVRRAGRGASNRPVRAGDRTPAPAPRKLVSKIPVYDLVDSACLDLIHDASMRILEDIGIEFRDEVALSTWREAGADVTHTRVRIPRQLVAEKLALAPSRFTFHGRNPERSVEVGGRSMAFAPVYGSPYVRDLSGQRRYAQLEDFVRFVKLAYLSPALNVSAARSASPSMSRCPTGIWR